METIHFHEKDEFKMKVSNLLKSMMDCNDLDHDEWSVLSPSARQSRNGPRHKPCAGPVDSERFESL